MVDIGRMLDLLPEWMGREKKEPWLLATEAWVILASAAAMTGWIVGHEGFAGSFVPFVIMAIMTAGAVWDARNGVTTPWYFTSMAVVAFAGCIARSAGLDGGGPWTVMEMVIERKSIAVLLTLVQPILAGVAVVLLCGLIGMLEEKLNRGLMGAGDIKFLTACSFFPMPSWQICQCVLAGLALTLVAGIAQARTQGMDMPVRALPWLTTGFLLATLFPGWRLIAG